MIEKGLRNTFVYDATVTFQMKGRQSENTSEIINARHVYSKRLSVYEFYLL